MRQAFWARGDTVGINEEQIENYIRNQSEEDCKEDRISI